MKPDHLRQAMAALAASFAVAASASPVPHKPSPAALPVIASRAMAQSGAKGIAIAITGPGKINAIGAYGLRNAKGDPLQTNTIMYGASLTKAMFAYMVLQLAAENKVDLDRPIAALLPRPLPEYADPEERYAPWNDLAGDPRWKLITPRMVFTHSTGFNNFFWLNPDGKLAIKFAPGSRFSYSGDGFILLQFGLERGLGVNLVDEMQDRVFTRFGMKHSAMQWRPDFAENLADGWKADGAVEAHDRRENFRAAGSLDTTITDMAKFSAGLLADRRTLANMVRPSLTITTVAQFPAMLPEIPSAQRIRALSAGLSVITFNGPLGPGFFKGGHNVSTGNMMVCLLRQPRCVVMMSNDVRAEASYPGIVRAVFGETGMPWRWEYGEQSWTAPPTGK